MYQKLWKHEPNLLTVKFPVSDLTGHAYVPTSHFICVWLSATPWTVAPQAPLSMGISRQEYWSRLPWPPPGDLPNPGIKPESPALWADSFLLSHWGSPLTGHTRGQTQCYSFGAFLLPCSDPQRKLSQLPAWRNRAWPSHSEDESGRSRGSKTQGVTVDLVFVSFSDAWCPLRRD